ncbi:Ceramide glucosyltransferase, partial [Coemansia sp. RSA 1935]
MNAGAAHNSPGAGMPSVITAADATRMSLNSSLISANLAAYTILVLAAFQWLLIFVSHCVLQRRYVRRRPFVDRPTDDYPGVTIIRPVKGVDHGMQRTLESSFLQEYPGPVEILFAVEDPDDLAIEVISNIIARYPKVQARVLIGKDNVGINPKVNNMLKA